LPDPAQPVSADWMREVSGGLDSAELLNWRLLVASDADSVVQVAGMDGWLTERASPVAREAAAAGRATAAISPTASSAAATSTEPSAAGRTEPGRVDRMRARGAPRDQLFIDRPFYPSSYVLVRAIVCVANQVVNSRRHRPAWKRAG
jgi:hypothetical protein